MSKTGVRLLPFGFSGSGFTLSMKEKMRERYSISIAAHCLYLLLEFVLLCDAIDLATALTRYIMSVRKVKGGGRSESGSKNWIARYKRAYLKYKIKITNDLYWSGFSNLTSTVCQDCRKFFYKWWSSWQWGSLGAPRWPRTGTPPTLAQQRFAGFLSLFSQLRCSWTKCPHSLSWYHSSWWPCK